MVSHWAEGVDGDVITIARLGAVPPPPGNGWPAARLRKYEDFINGLLETRILKANIPVDEETLGWTDEQMQAVYGGRMFYDKGDLVARATVFKLSFVDGKLVPAFRGAK